MKVGNNLFSDENLEKMAKEEAKATPMNQTQMDSTFFDIYANSDTSFENMTPENAAAGYYNDDKSQFDEFIDNTGAVGVSEFAAEPSEEEMAIMSEKSTEIQPGYYTYLEEKRKGEERAAKAAEAASTAKETKTSAELSSKEYTTDEQTIIDFAKQTDDPFLQSIAKFIEEPSAQHFSDIVAQFSSMIKDYTSEIAPKQDAEKEGQAGPESAPKQYDDRGFELNPDVVNGEAKAVESEYDDRGFKKNTVKSNPNTNNYDDIPAPIEENYTTDADQKDTGYGYN